MRPPENQQEHLCRRSTQRSIGYGSDGFSATGAEYQDRKGEYGSSRAGVQYCPIEAWLRYCPQDNRAAPVSAQPQTGFRCLITTKTGRRNGASRFLGSWKASTSLS